jgi:predicted nucleic acid-binding protein
MASVTTTKPVFVVVDASLVIALCAQEPDKLANAQTKMSEYASNGCHFYAPGVLVAECLFIFCDKLKHGLLTPTDHSDAVQNLIALMATIRPPPQGDKILIKRAEEIRASLGCSRSADGIYLALAEELSQIDTTEVVTFDAGFQSQATGSSLPVSVVVLPTV